MAKKKAKKKTVKKKKKKTQATGAPGVGAITIEPGNVLTLVPDTISVTPDSDVSFLIANADEVAHHIWINPELVINPGNGGRKQDPFVADIGRKPVPAGAIRLITLRTRKKAGFPHLPVTLKYTVESFTKDGSTFTLDPDLEVSSGS